MTKEKNTDDDKLMDLVRAIIDGKTSAVRALLAEHPQLIKASYGRGAERQNAQEFFFSEIRHYIYRGDTALHMAAAAYNTEAADLLLQNGARVAALNRLKAQPIHYACDGLNSNEAAQEKSILLLIASGADANAVDRLGVTCLHRAVRNRSIGAVRALLASGADIHSRNKNGSTPLHLAVQNTGKSGSGTDEAKSKQRGIVSLLLQKGASPMELDSNGRSVNDWDKEGWLIK